MDDNKETNAKGNGGINDNFMALNRVMEDEERRKRKERKRAKKRRKKQLKSSASSGYSDDDGMVVNPHSPVHNSPADTDLDIDLNDTSAVEMVKSARDVETAIASSTNLEKDSFLNNRDKGNDDSDGMIEIPHDTFSMFYAAKTFRDHVLPTCVFGLQLMIMILIAINLLRENDLLISNRMKVPVDVPLTVTLSQYIACFVSVFTADDLITGMVHVGKRILPLDDDSLPPPFWKWELSNFMRMAEGSLLIFVSFIFIVQSTTVIELFLNFAGVTFVGTLDNTSFVLALNGFFGVNAHRLAQRVTDMRAAHHASKDIFHRVGNRKFGRYVVFSVLAIAMWIGLSYFVIKQDKMIFACKKVYVNYGGNSKYAWTRHFSGVYKRYNVTGGYDGRAVYVKKEGIISAFIRYCAFRERWIVFDYDDDFSCDAFSLMSERTRSFDISEVGEFRFWTGESSGINVQCTDCNPDSKRSTFKQPRESCSFQGVCNNVTRECECDEGFFGPNCQFKGPCTEVVMHEPFRGYKSDSIESFPKSFELVYHEGDPLTFMEFPVYSQEETSRFMFYDGARYNVIEEEFNSTEDLYVYLRDINNPTELDVLYISEPTNAGSPTNVAFRAKIASVETWDDNEEIASNEVGRLSEKAFFFSCADCIADNATKDNGADSFCTDIDGKISHELCKVEEKAPHGNITRCNCKPGFMGPLCHIRPAEGKILLHLDQTGEKFCPVCGGETNDWSLWELDGIRNTCLPVPKKPLIFKGTNGNFTRQLGLNLNLTHFSVFVSNNNSIGGNDLCRSSHSVEIYSIMRNRSSEQIQQDYAIQLNNDSSYFGETVDPAGIECMSKTVVDQKVCDSVGSLTFAWIQLDMKITPVLP